MMRRPRSVISSELTHADGIWSRNLMALWLGQGVSQLGDRCYEVAFVWLLVGLTSSTLLIGAVFTMSYLPTVILLVVGGVWADRLSRRGILLASDLLRVGVTLVFAMLVTLGVINVVGMFVFAVAYALVGAFVNPALAALYPALIAPSDYGRATALSQVVRRVAWLVGPALGGLLIARWSVAAALMFDAGTFAVAVVATLVMRMPRQGRQSTDAAENSRSVSDVSGASGVSRPSFARELMSGIRFLLGEPGVLTIVLFFSFTNGLNDVEEVLVPVLARHELRLTAFSYGLLTSAFGAGALIGALFLSAVGDRVRHRVAAICGGTAALGGAIILMGAAPSFVWLILAYFVGGLGFITSEIVSLTLWQHIVPDAARGRVFSVMGAISMGMNPVGYLVAGALGQFVGVRSGLWIGGGLILALMACAYLLPAVRALDRRSFGGQSVAATLGAGEDGARGGEAMTAQGEAL